jgi:hypothetical protein
MTEKVSFEFELIGYDKIKKQLEDLRDLLKQIAELQKPTPPTYMPIYIPTTPQLTNPWQWYTVGTGTSST